MLPRLHTGPSNRITATALNRQARVTGTTSSKQRGGFSRVPVVQAQCRLVLRPTGNGNSDHIGDKVPLPPVIHLNDGVYEVGRTSPADIRIAVPTVSSRHALLRVEDNKMCITDLNSTNGTVVNGQELSPMDNIEVEVGSEVIFGDMYLARFLLDEVPDSEDHEQQQQASDGSSQKKQQQSPNNTQFVSWEQNQSSR